MIVKVCGVKHITNMRSLATSGVNWVGLNFYVGSKRFFELDEMFSIPNVKKVGVFVNSSLATIKIMVKKHLLDYVQLHGNEDAIFCSEVQNICPVIKVFSIDENFEFNITSQYSFCDFFLFDTKCLEYGGSGQKFEWALLNSYNGTVPFLLAGGISSSDVASILLIDHPQFRGIDINSKFEIEPGLKDIKKVELFISDLKNKNQLHG